MQERRQTGATARVARRLRANAAHLQRHVPALQLVRRRTDVARLVFIDFFEFSIADFFRIHYRFSTEKKDEQKLVNGLNDLHIEGKKQNS